MNTLSNASLQVVGVAAVSSAVIEIAKGNVYPAGVMLAIIGFVAYLIYEYTPSK